MVIRVSTSMVSYVISKAHWRAAFGGVTRRDASRPIRSLDALDTNTTGGRVFHTTDVGRPLIGAEGERFEVCGYNHSLDIVYVSVICQPSEH